MSEVRFRALGIPRIIAVIVMFLILIGFVGLVSVASVGVGEVGLVVDPLGGTVSNPVVGPRWFLKLP